MTGLWKTWMTVWCWGILLFGVAFAAAVFPTTEGGARLFYDLIYWPLDHQSPWGDPALRFTAALLGAVTIGWALTIMTLLNTAHHEGKYPLWRGLTASLLTWYLIDSSISVLSGVPVNAASNSVLVGLFLVPVLGSGVLKRP